MRKQVRTQHLGPAPAARFGRSEHVVEPDQVGLLRELPAREHLAANLQFEGRERHRRMGEPLCMGLTLCDRRAAQRADPLCERLKADGSDPVGSTPAEFAAFLHDEIAKWAKVIKFANVKGLQ